MTEKNWFIFKGDHHLGPFTFTEILNKVKLAELKNEELLWREGDADWKPVFNQEDIVGALRKEKEESNQARKELEDRARESQRKEFSAKLEKERESEGQLDKEKVKAIAVEKQRQRQLILEQEIARKEAMAQEAEQERIRAEKQAKQDELLKRAAQREADNQALAAALDSEEPDGGPPPLPPLPTAGDQELASNPGVNFLEENFRTEDQKEIFDENGEVSEEAYEEEYEQDYKEEYEEKNDDEDLKSRSFYGSIALVVGIVLLLFFSYSFLFQTNRSLAGLTKRDRDSLRNVMTQPFSGVALHKLRPTANLNSLWLSSNFPDQAAVYLRMESMKGRTLGEEKVVIQANSTFKGQAALFRELEVIEGSGLVAGEYLYEIKGFQTGLMKNLRSALAHLPVFKELKAFRPERSQFSFKGTILVASTSIKKFNSILVKKKAKIEKKVLRPLKDRRQRLKTFLNLLNKVESIYNNILGRITKGRSIHLFEKRYNKEVGPYLRDLIIDTNKIHISVINLDPAESKAYEDIMNFGKDVGHIASEMVTQTRKVRRLGRAKTEVMKERFRLMVEKLRQKGKIDLRKMNGIINQYEEEASP
jgi:hypothetical protein